MHVKVSDMTSRFRTLTSWTDLEIISEPYVVVTFKGYVAALEVLDVGNNDRYELLIAAKSLSDAMEPIRQDNGGRFTGMKIRIKKDGEERTSRYIVEPRDDLLDRDPGHALNYVNAQNISAEDKLWRRIERQHTPRSN
jgi:hypothetical protein